MAIVLMNDIGESLSPVARIKPDNGSIARMAAAFLAAHGFARLARRRCGVRPSEFRMGR